MSTFKWIPEVGDKFTGLGGVVAQAVDGRALDYNYAIRHLKGSNLPQNKIDRYGGGWPGSLEPLGKRAQASYDRQYEQWKQDQNPEAGDYVVCETGIYRYVAQGGLYIVKELTPTLAKELDYFSIVGKDSLFYQWRNFRKATDEEIAEYKRANKTVWDLESGDTCFILYASGHIREVCWAHRTYQRQRNRGLIFLTREAAEEADKKRVEENKQ